MKIHPDDVKEIIRRIRYLLTVFNYEKIILKIPQSLIHDFSGLELREEARIPEFYRPGDDAVFLAYYSHPKRIQPESHRYVKRALEAATAGDPSSHNQDLVPKGLIIRQGIANDIPGICSLYTREFKTYPFPIQELYYVRRMFDQGVRYYVGEISGTIIAAGSCEIDTHASAVEMSDLAVDMSCKGHGFSKLLLAYMEKEMKNAGVRTRYTICRGEFIPVNRLFFHAGYQFGGTLMANTNICGSIENMNIWYKRGDR